jgi:hypothetical protein
MADLRGANTMTRCRLSLTIEKDRQVNRYKSVLKNEFCNNKEIIHTKNYLMDDISRCRLTNDKNEFKNVK